MNYRLWPVLVFSMLCLPSGAADRQAEMWDEPSHQLVFERKHLRILDIRIVPGVTAEFHSHRYATTYFVVQDALMQNQEHGQSWSEERDRSYRIPGSLLDQSGYVERNSFHRVKNYDDRTFHLVALVNSHFSEAEEETDRDVSAEIDNASLNNQWFREHRLTVPARATSDLLRFAHDVVILQSHKGQAHILQDNIRHSVRNMPGAWSVHEAGAEFRIVNASDEDRQFVLVDVRQ